MNRRQAMRTAHAIVGNLIQSYFDVGQPDTDGLDGITSTEDAERIRDALIELRDRHDARGIDYRPTESGDETP